MSATWLLDCYNAHKDVTFYGIDLKTNIFPTLDDEQKRQIHLEAGNILQLPSIWSGKFQLVNQRLLMGGFSKENWDAALKEIYRVIAPGGLVQLVETSHWESGMAAQKHTAMFQDLFVKAGLLPDCVEHIPDMLKDTGFDQFKMQRHEIIIGGPGDEDEMNVKARKNLMGVFEGIQTPIVSMGVRTEAEFKEIMEDLEREWENNAQSKVTYKIFVAQKPVVC
jgi:SAM-dependent methyltransferase